MKTKDFLSKVKMQPPEDCCKLCWLHETFDTVIDYIPCPHCDKPLYLVDFDLITVGEHNGLDSKNITKCPVIHCENCEKYVGLLPTVIHYNANHDVYYTGEPCFLEIDDMEKIQNNIRKKMEASVKQFEERVRKGERSLSAFYLNLWMSRDVTEAIAEYLFEKGYLRGIGKKEP